MGRLAGELVTAELEEVAGVEEFDIVAMIIVFAEGLLEDTELVVVFEELRAT